MVSVMVSIVVVRMVWRVVIVNHLVCMRLVTMLFGVSMMAISGDNGWKEMMMVVR